MGGLLELDVPFQYLLYFLEDDAELERIATAYGKGLMSTAEIKNKMVEVVTEFVQAHQTARAKVTDAVLDEYFNPKRTFDFSRPQRPQLALRSDAEYAKMGIHFDRYYGQAKPDKVKERLEDIARANAKAAAGK